MKAPTMAEIIHTTKQSSAYKRMVEEANHPLIERMERENKFLQAMKTKRRMARYDEPK